MFPLAASIILAGTSLCGLPVSVTGPWTIEVREALIHSAGDSFTIPETTRFEIEPPGLVQVRGEKHESVPVFNPDTAGWLKGLRLQDLITQECTATGLLKPESVRLVSASDTSRVYELGKDFDLDPLWATLGRLETGAITDGQPVLIDYDYQTSRLDTVAIDRDGALHLLKGATGTAVVFPPDLAGDMRRLFNVWVPGYGDHLTDENLFPYCPPLESVGAGPSQAERFLPKTLAKLRAGLPVTIIAWGDSVTNFGGVDGQPDLGYQHVFQRGLQERFSTSKIEMLTAAWGGRTSQAYLDATPDTGKSFQKDVVDSKPDIVTIEFVNDAYLTEEETVSHYSGLVDRLNDIGAEVVVITPHLVRPDWMGITSFKLEEDPRPYVRGLLRFCREQGVAVADASQVWCDLWRHGIPYVTLEANSINHPDERGHRIFADSLLDLFPEE